MVLAKKEGQLVKYSIKGHNGASEGDDHLFPFSLQRMMSQWLKNVMKCNKCLMGQSGHWEKAWWIPTIHHVTPSSPMGNKYRFLPQISVFANSQVILWTIFHASCHGWISMPCGMDRCPHIAMLTFLNASCRELFSMARNMDSAPQSYIVTRWENHQTEMVENCPDHMF